MMKRLLPFLLSTFLLMATGLMANPEQPLPEVNSLSIEATVYPNPTTGKFHLTIAGDVAQRYELKIINLIGQEIERQEIQPEIEYNFDLSTYPKGIYFVQIEAGNESFIKRLVVR